MKSNLIKFTIIFIALINLQTECSKQTQKQSFSHTADFTITPETGTIETEFSFDPSPSNVDIEEQYVYKWDFNYVGFGDYFWDKQTTDKEVVSWQYTEAKTYEVVLQIVDYENGIDTRTKTLLVTDIANPEAPTAAFQIVNPTGYPKINLFSFIGESTDLQDPQDVLEVRWDWEGDGFYDTEFSTNQIATTKFQNPGIFDVTLQVKDTDDFTDEVSHPVTVLGPGGQPCPGDETVEYGDKTYHTVLIGNQCWMTENLNIGTMILNSALPSQNTPDEIIEKYCYSNSTDSCAKYGGLYNWKEMMQYSSVEGSQGICPNGWHIPTDEEWKQLEGTIDSQYGYPDDHWDQFGHFRGSDLGINIRSQSYWYNLGMGYDKFGFNAQPGGQRAINGDFEEIGIMGYYWTSTGSVFSGNSRWISTGNKVTRDLEQPDHGFAVRCIRN